MKRSLLLLALLAGGCYELPPSIPADYRAHVFPAGWPPLSVYAREPLHPANRWFQRAWAARDEIGLPERASADLVVPLAESLDEVDRLEIMALLDALVEEGLPEETDDVTRFLLHSDLLWHASRAAVLGDAELAAAYRAAAARFEIPCPPPEALAALEPPPVRSGSWVASDRQPGRPGDLGGSEVLFESDVESSGRRAVLLRMRAAGASPEEAVTCDLASECWLLEAPSGDESVVARVFRFDRAEHLSGREPWKEVPAEAEIAILDPGEPRSVLRGRLDQLCARCHGREQPFLSPVPAESS